MALRTAKPTLKQVRSRLRVPPKVVDPHYRSAEHKAWAMDVKRRAGFACQRCGARGQSIRLIADHVVELRDGGAPLDRANGECLCQGCHNAKTAAARAARAGVSKV